MKVPRELLAYYNFFRTFRLHLDLTLLFFFLDLTHFFFILNFSFSFPLLSSFSPLLSCG